MAARCSRGECEEAGAGGGSGEAAGGGAAVTTSLVRVPDITLPQRTEGETISARHPARVDPALASLWHDRAMDEGPRESAAGQLSILLEEYRQLRAEVNQRIGASASLLGFVAAGAAFVVGSRGGRLTWIAAAVLGVLVIAVWVSYLLAIRGLGIHLRQLEDDINACARTAYSLDDGAPLLRWEHSLANTGGWIRHIFRRAGGTL